MSNTYVSVRVRIHIKINKYLLFIDKSKLVPIEYVASFLHLIYAAFIKLMMDS